MSSAAPGARQAIRAVTTITPQRLSFAGGGSDIAAFYAEHGGAVVSSAINSYVYVTVKRHSPLFNEAYRLSYSKTEHVNHLDEMENDIARECLRLVHVEPPLYIATSSDLPALSGLGSSGSFAVGLLHALHALRGEEVSAGQLAEEACQVEIERLKRPIGKQDQYAAAFGGLNYITFQKNGRVSLDPIWLPGEGTSWLFRCSMLFWTGIQRDAGEILREQVKKIPKTQSELISLSEMAAEGRDILLCGPNGLDAWGELIDRGWQAKRSLSSVISNERIDGWYRAARQAGALGGKIAGAGGGGFLYLVVPPERHAAVRTALAELADVPIDHEPRGSRILSTVAN